MEIHFQKFHGLGNDFIIFSDFENKILSNFNENFPQWIQQISDRNTGIGFDGILIASNLNQSKDFDVQYNYFNSDGKEAQICGNGLRCFAKYIYDNGYIKQKIMKVKTQIGILECQIINQNYIQVEMGKAQLNPQQIPFNFNKNQENINVSDINSNIIINEKIEFQNNLKINITPIGTGNPHCVIILDKSENFWEKNIQEISNNIQNSKNIFPQGVNVGFVQIISEEEINLRVYERGCGETLACGSGACAAVVASQLNNLIASNKKCLVNMKKGQLSIKYDQKSQNIIKSGPAIQVFKGIINVDSQYLKKN